MTLDATLDVTVDDAVTFEYSVTATETVELQFRSGKIADVVVSDQADNQVWQWSGNRMFTQALQTRTVSPGSPLEQTFTWDEPEPGAYVAVAALEAEQSAQATRSFEV